MIVDLITNNRKILDFVKNRDGGVVTEIEGGDFKCFKLNNIPLSIRREDFYEDLYEDIDDFIREEKIDLNKFGYRVFDPGRNMIKDVGTIK